MEVCVANNYIWTMINIDKTVIDFLFVFTLRFCRMKLPATLFSFSIVILMVALAFAAVIGVVLYRMSVMAALTVSKYQFATTNAIYITTVTAALINLSLIFVFSWVSWHL